MTTDANITVEMRGPIFSAGINRKVLEQINGGLDQIAKIGEAQVKMQLYPGHGFVTGNLRESVAGDIVSDLHAVVDAGEHIQGRNVEYANYIEAGRGGFRGYSMFKNATAFLNRSPVVNIIKERILKVLR